MRGYLDDPAATAEAVDTEGWLHTGDIGRLDERGYLTITDRLKDMYICGGFNVYPAEVEQALARLDGVVESAVVGVPDRGSARSARRSWSPAPDSRSPPTRWSRTAESAWPTSRCPGRWSSAPLCRATRPARSSSTSSEERAHDE